MENKDHKRIFKFLGGKSYKITSREGNLIEFKTSFNWNSKDKYAKTIAAFANNRGGYIVFGVTNNPRELLGLANKNFEDTDEAKISGYLNSVLSPEIGFTKETLKVKRKKVGYIYVVPNVNKPVVCIKNDGAIKEAEIYYRYNASSEKIKYPELNILLNQIEERERNTWMQHFENISKIGPNNAAVLDTLKGKIDGTAGTLIIDKKLLPKLKFITEGTLKQRGSPTLRLIGDVKPVDVVGYKKIKGASVHITDDPSAPAVRIKEDDLLFEYSLDYSTLRKHLYSRYSDFSANNKFNKLMRSIKKDRKYCVVRYLNPKNPKSTSQCFYHPSIFRKFDKYYSLKKRSGKK